MDDVVTDPSRISVGASVVGPDASDVVEYIGDESNR